MRDVVLIVLLIVPFAALWAALAGLIVVLGNRTRPRK